MTDADFHIAFEGSPARYAVLDRFFDRLRAAKVALEAEVEKAFEAEEAKAFDADAEDADFGACRRAVVRDASWLDLLDASAIDAMTAPGRWSLEDLLDCLLAGDYELVGLTFDGRRGRLVYEPCGYPFGGTSPLVGLVEAFGLAVTRDSFHDGFAEWQELQG